MFYSRFKHIDIRHHYIWETVTHRDIELAYKETKEQVVDGFTKIFPKETFEKF